VCMTGWVVDVSDDVDAAEAVIVAALGELDLPLERKERRWKVGEVGVVEVEATPYGARLEWKRPLEADPDPQELLFMRVVTALNRVFPHEFETLSMKRELEKLWEGEGPEVPELPPHKQKARREKILRLKLEGVHSRIEIARKVKESESTVKKDITWLRREGFLPTE
jgi:hypothetical protein